MYDLDTGSEVMVTWKLENGLHPFHLAVQSCTCDSMGRWIASKVPIDIRTADGQTPLMYAAMTSHGWRIKELIKHGADINTKDTFGRTALFFAMINPDPRCIELKILTRDDTETLARSELHRSHPWVHHE